jgi:hypothetical protein
MLIPLVVSESIPGQKSTGEEEKEEELEQSSLQSNE